MGLFITFEGCEGCGKSTQIGKLHQHLIQVGVPVVLTREPGGTELGNHLRDVVKSRRVDDILPLAELFLFLASRSQLVKEVIRSGIEHGVVLCDRYTHSSVVYQGYGRGLDLPTVEMLSDIATDGLLPDLVILLDAPPEVGLARNGSTPDDRFETAGIDFHQRVRQGYLKIAQNDPARWMVIDALLPEQSIEAIIWERVKLLVKEASDTLSAME